MDLRSADFEYDLPPERIAQRPRPHDEQKMLIYYRDTGDIVHSHFRELPAILSSGDVLVVNNSLVVPAQLRHPDGTLILLMHPQRSGFEDVYAICPGQPGVGDVLALPGCTYMVKRAEPAGEVRIGDLRTDRPWDSLQDFLIAHGSTPLPPYVERAPDARDAHDYQTAYASEPGSIAAPTAGLHFNDALLGALRQNGIVVTQLTLHVGYGTFRRFEGDLIRDHRMDEEEFRVPAETVKALREARREGRRIIAVGTTATRVLESIADRLADCEELSGIDGSTRLFIYPPYSFRVIRGLITNLHYPRTSVMSLTAAFCGGVPALKKIYTAALERDYLFFSYGDGMLAL